MASTQAFNDSCCDHEVFLRSYALEIQHKRKDRKQNTRLIALKNVAFSIISLVKTQSNWSCAVFCLLFEPMHDTIYNKTCVTIKDSDQPVHLSTQYAKGSLLSLFFCLFVCFLFLFVSFSLFSFCISINPILEYFVLAATVLKCLYEGRIFVVFLALWSPLYGWPLCLMFSVLMLIL